MKNKIVQFLTLLLLFFTTQAFSNTINNINFVGLNTASESSLLKLMSFKVGQNYSSSSSNKIIESLFKTGLFEDISIIQSEDTLTIKLKENPYIKSLEMNLDSRTGFSNWLKGEKIFLTSEDLNLLQTQSKLEVGDIYTTKKLNEFTAIVESQYLAAGYYNSKINQTVSIDTQNRAVIALEVSQGDRAKIDSFTISGSEKFLEKDLLKLFKLGEADMAMFNYFTNKDDFTETELKQGIDLLTNTYFDSGYLDFKILGVESSLNEDKDKISIDILISEGIQYKVGKVSINGEFGGLSIDKINDAITLNEGNVFNRNLVIKNIQTLTDLFADKGYAFVDVNPITSEFLDSVNIDFEISLNQKTYINRITISGNTRTQDEVVRREIGVSEGSLYSRSILRKSLLKLRRLGYFSDVQISTLEVEGYKDKIDINFTVKETQTGSVSFSMSHSNNYGVSFGAGVVEKNIFGSGNTLNADFKISESYNKLSVYFMNPNFNDKGHSVSLGAFKSEIKDSDVAKDSYEIDTTGFTAGYGIPLADDTRINSSIEYSKNKIKCSSLFSGTGYESSQCAAKNEDEFKLNVNWNKNTLNNYMYPTEGVKNSLSTGISLPLGDYRYFEINADHASYSPINEKTTLKLTGSINLSKGFSGKELPFFKRHFGGGSGSVRGFGNKTLGPLYPNGKAKGGEISLLGSANLITPAFFFEDNEKMRMSAFIDAGNIYEKSSNIKLGDIRMSAGVGFAYLSPIGSIGAFISTPIIKKSGDTIESFGFSLGSGF
tara:strand:- start:2040 stop:4355 length:2316 start_codon:yes stop_codon:yes gene_type:complete